MIEILTNFILMSSCLSLIIIFAWFYGFCPLEWIPHRMIDRLNLTTSKTVKYTLYGVSNLLFGTATIIAYIAIGIILAPFITWGLIKYLWKNND